MMHTADVFLQLVNSLTGYNLLLACPDCLLQFMPNVSVTAELLMAVAEQLPRFSTHSLALVVWSLGALRLKPNKEWMNLVLRQAQKSFA
jgi:hypothetical protein